MNGQMTDMMAVIVKQHRVEEYLARAQVPLSAVTLMLEKLVVVENMP